MSKLSEQKEIVKLEKKLDPEKVSSLRGLSRDHLEKELQKLAMTRELLKTTKQNDEEYQRAREVVKELNAPYAEQMKETNTLHRFVALLMEEGKE